MPAGTALPPLRGHLAEHPVWSALLRSREAAARLLVPLVVSATVEDREPAPEMPAGSRLERLSLTEVVRDARGAARAGMGGLLVLGASDRKDEDALLASERDHIVVRAIRTVKQALPDLAVVTDVCVCSHTAHGQCLLFTAGVPDAARTHRRLGEIAVVHADAGADLVLVSGMLDGAVAAVRSALDEAGHTRTPVAALADLDSALGALERRFVGAVPITERAIPLLAADDPAVALARARRDVAAGADAIAVRPAATSGDVVALLARELDVPVFAYHAVDEHALLVAASDGPVDVRAFESESIAASRRAGAAFVVSLGAWAVAES